MNTIEDYKTFLESKTHLAGEYGFDPVFMPDMLFEFQKHLVDISCRKGRFATFADCGLGKTFIQLVWAENVVRKTNKRVLILTPIAVGMQTIKEAAKIGVSAVRSVDGKFADSDKIIIANYERLHYFNPSDFVGCVCDESSILKNFDGVTKAAVTEFMRVLPYRLLCTATAAPNDFVELGTSSEALGHMGYMDMLGRFFKKTEATKSRKDENKSGLYRFRGHAESDFWRWVCSWARAVRRPSDLGFSNEGFDLPELRTIQHTVESPPNPEFLINLPAIGLDEQRKERSRSIEQRCEKAAEIANSISDPVVSWCYRVKEGDTLTKMIPDAVQVSGSDSIERKEEVFDAFSNGQIRVLVTKPSIAGLGLNWQHCNRQTFFPSHSFEEWYQSIRRCWRFGQTRPVTVDVITSDGEASVLRNLQLKAASADRMFDNLTSMMGKELNIVEIDRNTHKTEIPQWL